MIIRKSTIQDLPYIYDICLKTGDSGKDATPFFKDAAMLGAFYAAPYIVHSSSDCFVVLDEGLVAGYILSTKDTNLFYEWLNKEWLPGIQETYKSGFTPKTEKETSLLKTIMDGAELVTSSWLNEYPAHLHIDLLPRLQGKGAGKTLMNTLFTHLSNMKISGIHLGVDKNNQNAIGFYNKIGFSILEEKEWGFVLGKKLN